MKKIMFLLLLIPVIAYSQSENKEKKQNKFGIGVGYSFNNVFGDSIHPFEIVLKYRLKDRHTFYLNVPFQISRKHKDLSNEDRNAEYWKRKKVYGIGGGYDYTIPITSNFSGFVGLGFEYTYYKDLFKGYTATTENTISPVYKAHWETFVKKNAYSLLPSAGVQYSIGHWEAEMRYKLYVSKIKEKTDDYYLMDEGSGSSYWSTPYLDYETSCIGVLSFYLTYFF